MDELIAQRARTARRPARQPGTGRVGRGRAGERAGRERCAGREDETREREGDIAGP